MVVSAKSGYLSNDSNSGPDADGINADTYADNAGSMPL